MTENEKPCGKITEIDYLSKIIAQNKKASDLNPTQVMSSPFTTVSADILVDKIAQVMLENKIRYAIVINKGAIQ